MAEFGVAMASVLLLICEHSGAGSWYEDESHGLSSDTDRVSTGGLPNADINALGTLSLRLSPSKLQGC